VRFASGLWGGQSLLQELRWQSGPVNSTYGTLKAYIFMPANGVSRGSDPNHELGQRKVWRPRSAPAGAKCNLLQFRAEVP
jgi:hypothetical protein